MGEQEEEYAKPFPPCTQADTLNCIKYICNLPFLDVLDPCKNTKFPGTLVTSLSRAKLPLLRGQPSSHMPYKATDIIPWIHPIERHIPPLQFQNLTIAKPLVPKSKLQITEIPLEVDTHKIDFGEEDGLFLVLSPANLRISQIDFGYADGLFSFQ
jgi:hypothetical protein